MDMGIIKNLKFYYRKRLVKNVLNAIEKKEIFSINILQAITLITKAWDDVKASTVSNCFRKAGFIKNSSELSTHDLQLLEEEEIEDWDLVSKKLGYEKISLDDFLSVDDQVIVAEKLSDSEILEMVTRTESGNSSSDDDDEDAEDQHAARNSTTVSSTRAAELLLELRQYVQQQENIPDFVFKTLNFLEDQCENKTPQLQTKLTDFFVKK